MTPAHNILPAIFRDTRFDLLSEALTAGIPFFSNSACSFPIR
jgi:hypothetical protein